jgi:hypothetical protein
MSFQRTIDIVTHVYCPPGLSCYAKHLLWQYASLRRYSPPEVCVRLKVCASFHDKTTMAILARVLDDDSRRATPEFAVVPVLLDQERLFRRAIGRNIATNATLADVVWYTDADYLFGDGCLDAVARLVRPDQCAMPARVKISTDHETGQRMVDDPPLDDDGWPVIDDTRFSERRERVAIGGLQIVGGDVVRERGYLREDREWQQPVDASLGFRSCKCDVAFRRYVGQPFVRLDIPNVYRIRHTSDGRDFAADGTNLGKQAW